MQIPYLFYTEVFRAEAFLLRKRLMIHLPWVLGLAWRTAPGDSLLTLLSALLFGLTPPLILLFTRQAVDAVVQANSAQALYIPLFSLALLLVLNDAAQSLRTILEKRLGLRLLPHVEGMILEKASSLSLRQLDQSETYDLLQRASKDLGWLVERLFVALPQILASATAIIAALSILLTASPWLGLIGLLTIPPLALVNVRRSGILWGRQRELAPEWRYVTYLNQLLTERPNGTELRAYQLTSFFVERWRAVYTRIRNGVVGSWAKTYRESLLALLVTVLAAAVSLVLIARQMGLGGASIGAAVALIGALVLLSGNVLHLANLWGRFWGDLLPVSDVQAFLALDVEERPPHEGAPFPSGPIRFEGVSFQYPGRTEPILDQLSFTIQPGERIALVGPNGAGKSTLVKLLLGLYQPTSGRITIGGVDLKAIAPAALRERISCIFQEFARFDLTVAENVAMGRLGASGEAITAAGEAAGLAEIVEDLPKGYETLLGKTFTGGADLSGGQWQRVALARAFVRNADLIILDEPTAALDARAELELFHRFLDLTAGKTALLISHRLGAARLADRIIVLDGGKVAEEGTHGALLAAGGLYADLFGAQAQFYEEVAVR